MRIERPPTSFDERQTEFLSRLQANIDEAIGEVIGLQIRQQVPEKAREGRIYYLTKDIDNTATEGWYVYKEDGSKWYRVVLEEVV